MKISDLNEAFKPKGPERIPTGGRGAINNPAHQTGAYYEGDPDKFDFKQQKKSYEIVRDALARSGKKLEYIAVARSLKGPDNFVATAPDFIWQKYVPNNPEGAQNMVYIHGVKIRLSQFTDMPPEKQDLLLSGDTAIIDLLIERAPEQFVRKLADKFSGSELKQALEQCKDDLVEVMLEKLDDNPTYITVVKGIEEFLKSRGVKLAWLTEQVFLDQIRPEMVQDLTDFIIKASESGFSFPTSKTKGVIALFPREVKKSLDDNKREILKKLLDKAANANEYVLKGKLDTAQDLQAIVRWPELSTIAQGLGKLLAKTKK